MHYLPSIYFVSQPLHVLGMFIAHHQEVFTVYVQTLVRVIRLSRLAAGRVRMDPASSYYLFHDKTFTAIKYNTKS
jgi:hypothetical protein